jgi:hypothetical protein
MAAAAVPLIIGATAFKAIGEIHQGQAQSAALQSQAAGSRYNAAVSRDQARQALQVSSAQQMQLRREQRQAAGRQRAAAAQAGIGEGGSARDVLEQSQTLAELDVLNVAYDGMLRARGYSTQSDMDEFSARAYLAQAKNVRKASYLNAIGTVLAGSYAASGSLGGGGGQRTTVSGGGGSGLRPSGATYYGSGLRYGY